MTDKTQIGIAHFSASTHIFEKFETDGATNCTMLIHIAEQLRTLKKVVFSEKQMLVDTQE